MKSSRRPSLKVADWLIATHLKSTRALQDVSSYPAHNCGCNWCVSWKRSCTQILPENLLQELERVGIEPSRPVDLYRSSGDENSDQLRVVFCLVGVICSGPEAWIQHEKYGALRNYRTIQEEPFVSLVVHRHEDLTYEPPIEYCSDDGRYLLLDFRLNIPRIRPERSKKNAEQAVPPKSDRAGG